MESNINLYTKRGIRKNREIHPHESALSPETFEVFNFPEEHRKKIRTSNLIERLNKTLKKRTRVVGIL